MRGQDETSGHYVIPRSLSKEGEAKMKMKNKVVKTKILRIIKIIMKIKERKKKKEGICGSLVNNNLSEYHSCQSIITSRASSTRMRDRATGKKKKKIKRKRIFIFACV